ncbi:unnamed protein product [Brassica oleracea var. botrytis]
MCKCRSHGTFPLFGLQSSHLNICYYHQDLHRRPLRPGSRPRFCSDRRALLLIEAWLLPRRPGFEAPDCPAEMQVLMDRYKDVFPEEIPAGLPPLRGIEHQIDFVPGAPLPNRAALYQSRSVGCAPVRDPANQLPYALRRRLRGRNESPGLGHHLNPRRSTPRIDRRTGLLRSASDRDASPAPIRFPPDNFKHSLTLFSKSFSSLPRGTCSLSVSRPYLALDGIYRPIGAAFPNNPTRRQRLVVRQGPGTTGLSPSLAPLSRELGPGPSLRTLLQTTIRTPKTSDFQAGLFPSFRTETTDDLTRIEFTTACQDAPGILSSDFGQPRAVTHGRPASVRYPREDWRTTICDTQADVPSARRLGAQLAFKDSMVHGILQFTPSIAFRYVLHRCESRDIRCRESF